MSLSNKPIFFVISGPSGAGKSTLGINIAPKEIKNIIDFDKERLEATNRYFVKNPDAKFAVADSQAKHDANKILDEFVQDAILNKKSFGYENMLWQEKFWKSAGILQEKGFKFHLAYLGLDSVDQSLRRIEHRKNTGGHNYVTNEDAKKCFYSNLEMLDKYFKIIDKLDIYDSSDCLKPKLLIEINKGTIISTIDILPDWVTKNMPDMYKEIKENQIDLSEELNIKKRNKYHL